MKRVGYIHAMIYVMGVLSPSLINSKKAIKGILPLIALKITTILIQLVLWE